MQLPGDRRPAEVDPERVAPEDVAGEVDDGVELRRVGRVQRCCAQAVAGICSTKSARQAGASKGFAKYSVIRAILPSTISPMPT